MYQRISVNTFLLLIIHDIVLYNGISILKEIKNNRMNNSADFTICLPPPPLPIQVANAVLIFLKTICEANNNIRIECLQELLFIT